MAVQVWIGDKPEHPNERRAIMALANGLDRLDGMHFILANFSVGGRTIDLVIIKRDAVFIIELKHCDGRVLGTVNGPWFVEGRNGEQKRLNPGRKNPYNQVISYFHALTNFLNEHRREFLSEQKASNVDFRTCKRVVVIAPTLEPDSEIELDWKVQLKGLDELPAYLITERSSEIELSEDEMRAIPVLLHCTPWDEINTVLRGVFQEPEAAPPSAPPDTAPIPPSQRWRIAIGLGVALLTLLIALLIRPNNTPLPRADQFFLPLAEVTGVPTGGVALRSAALDASCLWPSYQLVGKRWEPGQGWVSVANNSPNLPPDVVVILEEINTCHEQIALTWYLQNQSEQTISFPLRNDNIQISDNLGNQYLLDEASAQPARLRLAPGDKERARVHTDRPLSRNASSLVVRIKQYPFGEASFVVALPR
ncbi:NERD domain-containing protein [Oscillochloris trichoides DG-6]|uniref:NERD domain-containing protein n=1 Tax=Oscillochloris trichoides DG-6 TaxID=765420 RepID=E1IF91_9CHLR|nr:nuclease-related domain-containing protein [Oscillochloris trichoides]EFO80131.1 NERD domain-containing protein [Oscillochloris trichoides DG-6]